MIPNEFIDTYGVVDYNIINRDNYLDFVKNVVVAKLNRYIKQNLTIIMMTR